MDTHTWIWYISNPESLSIKARDTIEDSSGRRPLLISSISVWELYLLEKAGRLRLSIPGRLWVQKCEKLSLFRFIPVDNEIARIAVELDGNLHKDSADRIIIATAIREHAELITKDSKLHDFNGVKTIW